MGAGAAGRLYERKGGKYYSSLLLMIMLDHRFCASFQQHHSSGCPRRRGLDNGQSMRTVTDLARKSEMNLVKWFLLVWSKKPSCELAVQCLHAYLSGGVEAACGQLFPFAVMSVLDLDGHVHRECTNLCVWSDHDHNVQRVGTVTLDQSCHGHTAAGPPYLQMSCAKQLCGRSSEVIGMQLTGECGCKSEFWGGRLPKCEYVTADQNVWDWKKRSHFLGGLFSEVVVKWGSTV